MKQKKERPQFFALYKDFNNGKIEKYDVLNVIFISLQKEVHLIQDCFTILMKTGIHHQSEQKNSWRNL